MNQLGDGFGTALEGSLLARALQPGSGAREPHPHQPAECANCATPLVGAFCHACGQRAHLHRTIGAFMHDLLHGALHFEGKMWRTLPMLALRPGTLTRRYIAGARARFVSPMALFLFSVFLMFAVFQAAGVTTPTELSGDPDIVGGMEAARELAGAEARDLRQRLAELPAGDPSRPALEAELAEAEEVVVDLDSIAGISFLSNEGASISVRTANAFINTTLVEKWRKNPGLMLYKLQANSYKFSWLLIPLSLPFLWLLFAWKRHFNGYDHAIFATYSLGFMSLLFVTLSLLQVAGAPEELLVPAALIVPPLHIYKQLRGAYSLSRFSALWRLAVLLLMMLFVIGLFLYILVLLGAF